MADIVINQCKYCKIPFQSYGSIHCMNCIMLMDESFIKIRDYLDEHPNSNMYIVSEGTDVSVRMITYLLKEGRLLLRENDNVDIMLKCESCKKPITTGRLCEECRGSIAREMQEKIGSAPVMPKKDSKKAVAKIEIEKN